MQVTRLGVHESVDAVFPPDRLRAALADGAVGDPATEVVVVDDRGVADCDAVVTFEHRAAFLPGPADGDRAERGHDAGTGSDDAGRTAGTAGGGGVEWVHSIQSGIDRFPTGSFAAAGVALTNSAGLHGTSVGETVAGYMLTFARRLHRHRDRQRDREWERPDWDAAFTLDGETVCVVGLGTLGRGVADHATGLGMRAVGVRRSGDPVPGVDRVYGPDELPSAVEGALFVVLAVPLTDATRSMVGADELAAMREDAYLVNVARGPVVDQDALVAALRADRVAGAALDVFDPEPLPASSPLWGMDEVLVTPHCAAFDREYYREIAALVAKNLRRVVDGDPLENRVV